MTHTNSHSETLTAAIQPRTMEMPSAQLRHSRSCFAEANQQSGFAEKLLAVAAAIAVFSAALAWPFSSQRLEAQTIEVSPEPVIHATGQQSLSSVPSDAIRLFYNCTEDGEESSLVRHSYVRVFSSRNVSSCSGYEEGDYILRAVIDGRFPGLYYPSGTFRFNVRFETYIVGSVPWASEGDARVEDFDYYIDGTRYSVSALGCGTNLVSRSLSFSSSVFETTLLCNSVYWERVLARHWIVPGENTTIHILPPEFTEWPLPLVQVIRLEVTQGVQDWNNSLTLVRNRRTVVRAFMETAAGSERELTAQLQGKKFSADGGVLFTETTDSVNPGLSVTVMPNVVERRGNIDASLNFILPAHWTDLEENEELRLELVSEPGSNTNCYETIEDDDIYNRCVERVGFTEVIVTARIQIVPIGIVRETIPEITPLSDVFLQVEMMEALLPVSDLNTYVHYHDIDPFETIVDLNEVNALLRQIRSTSLGIEEGQDLTTENLPIYVGILPGNSRNTGNNTGLAINGRVQIASWFTQGIDEVGEDSSFFNDDRNVGSHELAHLLGQSHPATNQNNEDNSRLIGVCGETAPLGSDEYDYFGLIDTGEMSELRPVLGSLDNFETEVWGTDTRSVYNYYGDLTSSGEYYGLLSVIDPYRVFSFMSYCPPLDENSQGRWMDNFHHDKLIERYIVTADMPESSETSSREQNSNVLSEIFAGSIILSSSGDATNVIFEPVFSWPRPSVTSETGDYVLEMRDAAGDVIRSINFDAQEPIATTANTDTTQEQRKASFAFIVSNPPKYSSLTVTKAGTEIISVVRSQNSPNITISGPPDGEEFKNNSTINVSWVGSDSDGDKLIYRVYYSTDGGSTYRVLSPETKDVEKRFPAALLEGSNQARIGVSASDGFRSSFAETPIFSVAGHTPTVQIKSPSPGAVFAEKQGFLLEATGYDIEDGMLPSTSFVWASNIDGNLGTGEFLVLSANDLSLGAHTITLSATDSDSMIAMATVNITIAERNTLPVANDDEVFGGLEETLRIDVLANDTDVERDFDLSSLTIDTQPQLGIAKVSITKIGMPMIEYSPITGGEDTFTYYICDGLYRCDSAEVTVVFPDCTITGTRGSDNLVGTSAADVICGLDGDDTIDGKGGNDLIYAGFGEDLVYGRTGDDTIYGGPGNDIILGHRGDDTIYGGLSNDRLWGGGGDDTIWGGDETDELYGEADNDTLYGNDGPDKIHGGQGDDSIYGGKGDDSIRGNAGADTIYPGSGNDTVLGNSQVDTVIYDVSFR